ncbi:MAG: YebC/PmpR family DNA-binding transcriptional regulator [bacterium]|nr:YebC/PmpR family DNA-binding transcriptional regulator [bacterium]
MSGHSHWSGIKHKKEITDKKRGKVFSKLLKAITVAVGSEPNPDFNPVRSSPPLGPYGARLRAGATSNGIDPRLRAVIQRAKEANVPMDNIERAIKKASEPGAAIEELLMESYGPGGSAVLIEALTDSKNRTIAEVKKILSDHGAKWAEPGSVLWAFAQSADLRGTNADNRENWVPKFPQELSQEDGNKLAVLIEALEEHEDVQEVYTNAKI